MANNESIQILRGETTFDPLTSDVVLKDGQPFYSKKYGSLYIGDGVTKLKELTPMNYLTSNVFSKNIYTVYPVGNIQASMSSPNILFRKGHSLEEECENIFDKVQQPSKSNPYITITLSGTASGEYGTPIDSLSYSVRYNNGSYTYGPTNTGVTWDTDSLEVTYGNTTYTSSSGTINLSGAYVGDGVSRSISVSCDYSDGVVAYDNKGNNSSPEVKITSSADTDSDTHTSTATKRQFIISTNDTVDTFMSTLKTFTSTTTGTSCYSVLSNSKISSVKVKVESTSYVYFVVLDSITKVMDSDTGFGVPVECVQSDYTFTNQYSKTYKVKVYRTSNKLNSKTYNFTVS